MSRNSSETWRKSSPPPPIIQQPPSALATLSQQIAANAQSAKSSLWELVASRLPDIRNATHYYAHDIQKFSVQMIASSTASNSTGGVEDQNNDIPEKEVHYQPNPLTVVGISVRSVAVERLSCGISMLVLIVDSGFATFDVTHNGVFEHVVQLDVPQPMGSVVQVCPRTCDNYIILYQSWIGMYHVGKKHFDDPIELPCQATALQIMQNNVVVTSSEYSQLFVLSMKFEVLRTIVAERPVIASSASWLAYCGSIDTVPSTRFVFNEAPNTMLDMAKAVQSGISAISKGIWGGGSSTAQHLQSPLGSVVIYDVILNRDIASFGAHNHAIQCMQFDGSGTILATASGAGTTVNVFQVAFCSSAMVAAGRQDEPVAAACEVALLYRLNRGITSSRVTSISFGPMGTWAAICTSVGTCHFYEIPEEERNARGRRAASHLAPFIAASSRARSAPSSSAVNPVVHFFSSLSDKGCAEAILVSASGMVCVVRCTANGAQVIYTKHIDNFNRRDSPSDAECEVMRGGDGEGGAGTAAQNSGVAEWIAHLELNSHPTSAPLVNFEFGYDSPDAGVKNPLPVFSRESRDELLDRFTTEGSPPR